MVILKGVVQLAYTLPSLETYYPFFNYVRHLMRV